MLTRLNRMMSVTLVAMTAISCLSCNKPERKGGLIISLDENCHGFNPDQQLNSISAIGISNGGHYPPYSLCCSPDFGGAFSSEVSPNGFASSCVSADGRFELSFSFAVNDIDSDVERVLDENGRITETEYFFIPEQKMSMVFSIDGEEVDFEVAGGSVFNAYSPGKLVEGSFNMRSAADKDHQWGVGFRLTAPATD